MWFFVLLLAWPLIEIALFVTIGGAIGLLWTLVIIFGTAVLGIAILRQQGVRQVAAVRDRMRNPLGQLAQDALLGVAALLLFLPGFLTDALGLLLLLPPVRQALVAAAAARTRTARAEAEPHRPGVTIIEGEFHEVDPEGPDRRPPSGWTRH